MSSRVALAAARTGAAVQVVGRTGDDPTADAVVLDLARGGVGHVALLRDPARATALERQLPETVTTDPLDEEDEEGADDEEGAEDDEDGSAGGPSRPTLEAADVELGLR